MNDKTITIYNRKKSSSDDTWQRTVIHGVDYSYRLEKTVSSNGAVVMTELLTVIIPITASANGREYIDAVQFSKLDDVSKYWTIDTSGNKDMIVCGEIDKEISEVYKITELKKDYQKVGVVSGFSDNTDARMLKHYKVVCK